MKMAPKLAPKLAWAIARRELRGGLRGFWVFLACLSLGVAAIAGVGMVRAAIEAGLAEQGAVLLGGDAQVEFTYRFADAAERDWMEARAEAVSAGSGAMGWQDCHSWGQCTCESAVNDQYRYC